MTGEVSTGATITFAGGFFAEILDINLQGRSRGSVQTSHMGTSGQHTFVPTKLSDPGGVQVEFAFDPTTAPPIDDAPETVTITWEDGSTWAATGFMTDFENGAPLEDKMTGSATLKFSGAITVTPAA